MSHTEPVRHPERPFDGAQGDAKSHAERSRGSAFWKNRKVIVTGGAGFLGAPVVEILQEKGAEVFVPRRHEYNLIHLSDGLRCFAEHRPEVVIHSAAYYGGIWINQMYPGKIFYDNLMMAANVIEACRLSGVQKFVGVGTACSYPGYLTGELKEEDLWNGQAHETVRNYGAVKKMMQLQCWAYKKQYGFNGIHVILTNLYGPGDSYNPDRSHVVAALIRKFVEAQQNGDAAVEVWGTGRPIREFLYVKDAAEAIVLAAERYDDVEPVNIGTGIGTSIRELAETIQDVVRFEGKLNWNTDKPDGQMKKILDVRKMRAVLEWQPPTSLREGLEKTITWYVANKAAADARL